MKKLFETVYNVLGRLLLTLFWLILLGIGTDLETSTALLVGFATLILFVLIHVVKRVPKGWDRGRLQFRLPPYYFFLIFLALLLLGGDIFWVYHTRTSIELINEPPDPVSFMVLGIIAFPLIEEFGFRLWAQGYLETRMNKFLAVLTISLVFATMHKPEMPVPQLLSGLLYGLVLIRTSSIWFPVIIHALHNGILILSGEIEWVKHISYQLMDRPGNLNLILAVIMWILTAIGILFWWQKSKKHSIKET